MAVYNSILEPCVRLLLLLLNSPHITVSLCGAVCRRSFGPLARPGPGATCRPTPRGRVAKRTGWGYRFSSREPRWFSCRDAHQVSGKNLSDRMVPVGEKAQQNNEHQQTCRIDCRLTDTWKYMPLYWWLRWVSNLGWCYCCARHFF